MKRTTVFEIASSILYSCNKDFVIETSYLPKIVTVIETFDLPPPNILTDIEHLIVPFSTKYCHCH